MQKRLYYNTSRDLVFLVGWQLWSSSVDLFPNLGQAVAVDAQVPLAKVTEGCDPDCISIFAEPLSDSVDNSLGEIRGGGFTAEMGEGVNNDILEISFVGKPLDVLQALPQDRSFSIYFFVGFLGVDENNNCLRDIFIAVLIGNLGQGLRVGFPVESLRLETKKLHAKLVVVEEVLQ